MRPYIEKHKNANWRLEQMGLAIPGKIHGLTGTVADLACEAGAGQVSGRVWNQTEPSFRSKPGPLVGYRDPLLILPISSSGVIGGRICRIYYLPD